MFLCLQQIALSSFSIIFFGGLKANDRCMLCRRVIFCWVFLNTDFDQVFGGLTVWNELTRDVWILWYDAIQLFFYILS